MLQKILFLTYQQYSKKRRLSSGFTLIELLVALVISSIIISSLLGFMVNILTTDRREQAKSQTEQELQTAADYIARDLEQAIYVYDATGLRAITGNYSTTLCTSDPTANYNPETSTCSQIPVYDATAPETVVPVLAFWKRELLLKDQKSDVNNPPTPDTIGCLVEINKFENKAQKQCNNQDYPVYSLVVYYLVKDSQAPWSNAARIARFQISDGIPSTATPHRDGNRTEVDPSSGRSTTVNYDLQPSKGFMPFNLRVSGANIVGTSVLQDKMNRWQKHKDPYDISLTTLIDFIDQTSDATKIPLPNSTLTATNVNSVCTSVSADAQLVPNYSNTSIDNNLKTGSFYACVDATLNITEVHLRGNALARIDARNMIYDSQQSAFFPTATIRIQGRGFVSAN